MKRFFLVADGDAREAVEGDFDRCDFIESVICFCDTEAEALELARRHDAGEIQADNVICPCCGVTVAALFD